MPQHRPLQIAWRWPSASQIAAIAALFAICLVVIYLSHHFAREDGRVASIWPLNAIVLAVLMRARSLNVASVVATAAIANITIALLMGDTVVRALSLTGANVAEILICWRILAMDKERFDITRLLHLVRFVCVAGVLAPAVSALIAAWVLAGTGPFVAIFGRWFAADALGMLIFAPALLAFDRHAMDFVVRKHWFVEAVACFALVAVVSVLVFGQNEYPLIFLIPCALTLVTFRLGINAATVGLIAVAVIAIAFAIEGKGPTRLIDIGIDHHFVLQAFLAVMSLATLPIASVLAEQRRDREEIDAARAEALESGLLYRTLADYSTDIVIRLGKGGIVSYVSPACRILGITPEQAIGRSTLDFILPEDRDFAKRTLEGLFTGAEPDRSLRREFRVKTADGSVIWLEGNPSIIRDADGQPVEVITAYRDVTLRRSLEDELMAARAAAEFAATRAAESERRYRKLAEISLDMIGLVKMDATIMFVSPSCATILGFEPNELIGTTTFSHTHPDDIPSVKAFFSDLIDEGANAPPRPYQYRAKRKDGSYIWLEGIPRVLYDEDGRPLEIQDSARDISTRKQLEHDLAATREVAEAASGAKSEFLANMSHEIRTPLNSIIGFARLLETNDALAPAERSCAEVIGSSSRALLGIVNDILNLSALEVGAFQLDARPFSPARMSEAAVDELRLQAEAKGLSLTLRFDGEFAPLMGDEGRLRQVIVNLVSNAIKFTDAGAVSVVVEAGEQRSGNQVFAFAVTDTGSGIPSDLQSKLFTRFSQLDSSYSRRFEGSGLGLAISKRFIELMGGEIGVASREGAGSTFWFEVELPVAADTEEGPEPRYTPSASLLPLDILVVDDVEINRMLLKLMLPQHEVDFASGGEESLLKMSNREYDVVFMDVQMPGMDGLAATRAARAKGIGAPIIALSAHVLRAQVEACIAAGMDGHLTKPIDPEALQSILVKWSRLPVSEPTLAGGEIMDDLRAQFILGCREYLNLLRQSLRDGGSADQELRRMVHHLAGASSVFGFRELGQAALTADQSFIGGDHWPVAHLTALQKALEAACIESAAV